MKRTILLTVVVVMLLTLPFEAEAEEKVFRLGMIGLDTSHVIAFTRVINDPAKNYGCKVVVGYAGGSPDIPSSANRVEKFTNQLRDKFGVEIVDTIEELCQKVDGVLLESVDGRPHLEQARPVIAAKKPIFIDKPMAGNLADVLEIFQLAKENNVPCWSSSSLRFSPDIIGMRDNEKVGECSAATPLVRAVSKSITPISTGTVCMVSRFSLPLWGPAVKVSLGCKPGIMSLSRGSGKADESELTGVSEQERAVTAQWSLEQRV